MSRPVNSVMCLATGAKYPGGGEAAMCPKTVAIDLWKYIIHAVTPVF